MDTFTPTNGGRTSPRWPKRTSQTFFGVVPPAWKVTVGDLVDVHCEDPVDRVVLDMLAPWECVDAVAEVLRPGGVLCCYVATTTQLSTVVERLREHGGFTEPAASETLVRTWHVEGLAVRPDHRMIGHTGFLVTSRRLGAWCARLRPRRRRPAKGSADGFNGIPPATTQSDRPDTPGVSPGGAATCRGLGSKTSSLDVLDGGAPCRTTDLRRALVRPTSATCGAKLAALQERNYTTDRDIA